MITKADAIKSSAEQIAERWKKGELVYADMFIGNSCLKLLHVHDAIRRFYGDDYALGFMKDMLVVRSKGR